MPANRRFRNLVRIGPVQVATCYDGRGREKHTTACTAPRCGFSTDYDSRAAAEICRDTAHLVPDPPALKPFRPDTPVRPVESAPAGQPHPVTD